MIQKHSCSRLSALFGFEIKLTNEKVKKCPSSSGTGNSAPAAVVIDNNKNNNHEVVIFFLTHLFLCKLFPSPVWIMLDSRWTSDQQQSEQGLRCPLVLRVLSGCRSLTRASTRSACLHTKAGRN